MFKYLEGDPHPSIALVDQKTTTTPSTILRGLRRVALVREFAWLREHLNAQIASDSAKLYWQGMPCRQIFSINYGVVEYVDWDQHRLNTEYLSNPIVYTYLKAVRFSAERELRVSLRAPPG